MKYIFVLLILVSCNNEEWKPSPTQAEYLNSLPLEGKVFFESCLSKYTDLFEHCITKYRKLGQPDPVKVGPSATDIAVGTAVGRMLTPSSSK